MGEGGGCKLDLNLNRNLKKKKGIWGFSESYAEPGPEPEKEFLGKAMGLGRLMGVSWRVLLVLGMRTIAENTSG